MYFRYKSFIRYAALFQPIFADIAFGYINGIFLKNRSYHFFFPFTDHVLVILAENFLLNQDGRFFSSIFLQKFCTFIFYI